MRDTRSLDYGPYGDYRTKQQDPKPYTPKGFGIRGPCHKVPRRSFATMGFQQGQNISFKVSFPKIGGSTLGVPIRRILVLLESLFRVV